MTYCHYASKQYGASSISIDFSFTCCMTKSVHSLVFLAALLAQTVNTEGIRVNAVEFMAAAWPVKSNMTGMSVTDCVRVIAPATLPWWPDTK